MNLVIGNLRRKFALLTLIAISLGTSYCGGGGSNSIGASGSNAIAVTPQPINFGNTTINSQAATTVTISNNGSSPVDVLNVALSNPGAFALAGWEGSVTLQPSQSLQVKLTFQPVAETSYASSLEISTTAAAQTVAIAGAGVTGRGISVSVTPKTASLVGGQTQQFKATVSGTSNSAVTWSVQGVGTVSTSGLYTAPEVTSVSTATVTAASSVDPSKSASATVTISPRVESIIDVTSYGASGDGNTDDTAAINNAISALSPGYELYLPCGTYRISSALKPITLQNITVAGTPGCTVIKGVNSGYTIVTFGTASVSSQTALTAVGAELSNQISANLLIL